MAKAIHPTDEQLEKTTQLAKLGLSQDKISEALGVSRTWFRKRVVPLLPNAKQFSPTPRRDELMSSELFMSGETFNTARLARELGWKTNITNNVLYHMLHAGLVDRVGPGIWRDGEGMDYLGIEVTVKSEPSPWLSKPFSANPLPMSTPSLEWLAADEIDAARAA